ncbi:MAG: hypothetical protein UR87_C0019G0013 [candidate division CPR3 bacterium GW2011_GWE2_35_7]|nr:MAG: hypothetical protein UR87_C0019G0013 [candidate division CPR3 bacterium GW2011_GWE2_35_7]
MFSTKELIKIFTDPLNLIIYLGVSFVLGILIAYVYKKSNRSVSYSQSFVNTIVLLLPVITMIIMFISNNLATAIGVFGAFSVVRFRTAIKDSKDMFFVFCQISSAVFVTMIIAFMVYFLNKINFGKFSDYDYLFEYVLDTSKSDNTKVIQNLKKLLSKQNILNVQSTKDGKELEITMSLVLKKGVTLDQLTEEVKKNNAVKNFTVNPAKFDLEY